jgi:hypothetical protein
MTIADPLDMLRAAVKGLTYPSESDEPFDVMRWENPKGADIPTVLAANVGKGRAIREVSVDEFFGQLEDADETLRYRALRATLESMASGVRPFRVGEGDVRVDVYVLGQCKIDKLIVGVHSVSVET